MFKRGRSAQDFADEIKAHLELEADQLRTEGESEQQARIKARRHFGNVRLAEERFYLRGRFAWFDQVLRDLRYGLRSLARTPGFAITVILTLALGMGANTAVFSVMNAVLLRSLPVAHPEQVVILETSGIPDRSSDIDTNDTLPYPVYRALKLQNALLTEVIAVGQLSADKVNLRIGNQPEQAQANMVSGNFFSGLGVTLSRGRAFTDRDETESAPVAVISDAFWSRRFSRDPAAIGSALYLKGVPFTIIGVTGKGFEGTEAGHSIDLWIPLQNRIEFNVLGNPLQNGKLYQADNNWWCLHLLGRLAPGVSRAQALAGLEPSFEHAAYTGLGGPLPGEKPPTLRFADPRNFPGYEDGYGKPLRMLMAMVGLVLLIALTNVVMLLMARNAARQREFSLRLALGAGHSELLIQLLTESILLVTAGGALAWVFAEAATRTLARWAHIETSFAPDRTVLLFTLAVLCVATLLFGLAPYRVAVAGGAGLALKTSAATSNSDLSRMRMGKAAVALQMSLSIILLVGGGLLARSLRNLQTIPMGMKIEGLVVFGLNPQSFHNEAALVTFYQDLERRLRTLPGVEGVSVMAERLGSGWSNNSIVTIDGVDPDRATGKITLVRNNDIGADFFHTLCVPILMGREFTDADTASSPKVAIVNQLFAQHFFGNRSPLGHQVNGLTIIGVVNNHKYRSMEEEPIPMAWWNYTQAPAEGEMQVEMRVRGDAMAILPTVRRIVASMDPDVPLIEPTLQRTQFEQTISQQLLFARLGEFFALLAIILVATGLYGTLAYRVNRRAAEIGVRMALGARRSHVVWIILRESLLLTALGMAIGIPLAILAGHTLTATLHGVKPWDAPTLLVAIAGVTLIALLASALPARRAASIAPSLTLRSE